VLPQDDWTVLSFPAIAEVPERAPFNTPYGHRLFVRQPGEALHPEHESVRERASEYDFLRHLCRDGIGEPSPVQSTPAKFDVILDDQRRQRKNWTFNVLLLDHRSQGGRARDALAGGHPGSQPPVGGICCDTAKADKAD
jgi:hypothetical protein